MSEDDMGSILTELNKGFQELRTLILTVGSILAMLMAGLNEVGFIDLAVDTLTNKYDGDDNPFVEPSCEEDWQIIEDSYLVGDDITINVRFADNNLCSYQYNGTFMIETIDGDVWHSENASIRNSKAFSVTFSSLPDGTYRLMYSYFAPPYMLESGMVHYEVDRGSHDENIKVYGCTDTNATNYDANATDEDGSCEYEEEPTDNCYASIYDAYSYWADNNTSIYTDFDVDWSCEMYANVTVVVEIWDEGNETLILSGSVAYETNYMDVDYNHVDFLNVTGVATPDDDWLARVIVLHTDTQDDEVWRWVL